MEYSFIIRRAKAEEAEAVYEILQKAFMEYANAAEITVVDALNETAKDIRSEIENKLVYIALIDEKIVGTVRVDVYEETAAAYISRFAVDLENRNIGIGKSLMNLVDKYLKSRKVKAVYLHTASRYTDLVRFYYGRKFYVEQVERDRGYIRVKMRKDLLD